MDGNRHHRLEGRSGSQDRNVDDEDATSTRYPATGCAAAKAAIGGWENRAGRCNGQRHADGVADIASSMLEG